MGRIKGTGRFSAIVLTNDSGESYRFATVEDAAAALSCSKSAIYLALRGELLENIKGWRVTGEKRVACKLNL